MKNVACFLDKEKKNQIIDIEIGSNLYKLVFIDKELSSLYKFLWIEGEHHYVDVEVDVNLFNVVSLLTKDLFEDGTK